MRVFGTSAALAAVLALAAASVPASGDSSSIAGAGQSGWTTPPGGSLQDAPILVTGPSSAPAAPPPPPAGSVVDTTPYSAGTAPCAPPPVAAAPLHTWSGCGLPCASGVSMWYLTGVFGRGFWEGDDSPEDCLYWGFDIGRTFCGCWGLDLFYRYSPAQFSRNRQGDPVLDGGAFHHVGLKFTYDIPIGGNFYAWTGIGPEYWWTQDYLTDDSGIGVFGELGVGYVFNRNLRLRAGVNVHGVDTDTTRLLPADDGQSRWLWTFAPVVELEFAF